MTDLPDVTEALGLLRELLPLDISLTPATRVVDAGLDSLAVLEWMFALDVDPLLVFAADQSAGGLLGSDTVTLADLYDMFRAAKSSG